MTEPIPQYDPGQVDVDPYGAPLETLDVSNPYLFASDAHGPWFKRLRDEAPVHFCPKAETGPYWSVTRYDDILYVDTHHDIFSSEPIIVIRDPIEEFPVEMFIAMDPPRHDEQRAVVQPVVAPANLMNFEPIIRERTRDVLDHLPVGERFDWVERVSIELTTQMLATLFDFPFEERRRLTRWSDVATNGPQQGVVESLEQRRTELLECLQVFTQLWHERAARAQPGNDLISMLAHGQATRDMINRPMEYLGNLMLLIVGGNDTTRNSISGGVLALNRHPEEYAKLRRQPELVPNMVAEIIRWQTPLTHMRRTASADTVLGGKRIRKGDKVIMWYLSGNRDPEMFDDADAFVIDRPNARQHMSFGFGIHRCMGNRVGEMQLRVLWEEILERFHAVELAGAPVRNRHTFIRGFTELPVRLIQK